jgi:predicted O-methyltransferase YrrM
MTRYDFAKMLNEMGLKGTSIEIGVGTGMFSLAFLKEWQGKKHYCVDTWYDLQTGETQNQGDARYEQALRDLLMDTRISVIRKSSVEAAKDFDNEMFDFVYIDAAHDYEYVIADLKAWFHKVKIGGIIAGHDLNYPGVIKAVEEFFGKDYLSTDDAKVNEWQVNSWWVKKKGILKTSISEEMDYLTFCKKVIEDETGELIKTFRRAPEYDIVVPGNRPKGMADRFIEEIIEKYSWIYQARHVFKNFQDFGNPNIFETFFGYFDENLIRHILVLGRLTDTFGSLESFRICEVGPGGGLLFKIITDYFPAVKYTFVDLKYPLLITRKFVEYCNKQENVESYLDCNDVLDKNFEIEKDFDLFVSDCAISECYQEVQEQYIDKLCNRSLRGRIALVDCMDFKGKAHLNSKEIYDYLKRDDKKLYSDPKYGGIIGWGETRIENT